MTEMKVFDDDTDNGPWKNYELAEKFESYMCCAAVCTCCVTWGIVPQIFTYKELVKGIRTRVNADTIEHREMYTDCCCKLAKKTVTIPLENVTDVTLTTGCCLDCYGLKSVAVQTAGSPMPEATIVHLKDPEQFRKDVLAARKDIRDNRHGGPKRDEGPAAVTMTSAMTATSVVSSLSTADPIAKLQRLKELYKLGVFSRDEYEALKARVAATPDFTSVKQQIMNSF
ncbi:hypothetical protein Pelo_13445 [Pelomyxa schiedti]|nr:hypothetical protein Pelo_13445 [Pelomyxa schiedti]